MYTPMEQTAAPRMDGIRILGSQIHTRQAIEPCEA